MERTAKPSIISPARLACHEKREPNNALEGFDKLPDSAYVRVDVVSALRNCSNATTWRHAKARLIPAPRKLSPGITGWNVGELRRAIAISEKPIASRIIGKKKPQQVGAVPTGSTAS